MQPANKSAPPESQAAQRSRPDSKKKAAKGNAAKGAKAERSVNIAPARRYKVSVQFQVSLAGWRWLADSVCPA